MLPRSVRTRRRISEPSGASTSWVWPSCLVANGSFTAAPSSIATLLLPGCITDARCTCITSCGDDRAPRRPAKPLLSSSCRPIVELSNGSVDASASDNLVEVDTCRHDLIVVHLVDQHPAQLDFRAAPATGAAAVPLDPACRAVHSPAQHLPAQIGHPGKDCAPVLPYLGTAAELPVG